MGAVRRADRHCLAPSSAPRPDERPPAAITTRPPQSPRTRHARAPFHATRACRPARIHCTKVLERSRSRSSYAGKLPGLPMSLLLVLALSLASSSPPPAVSVEVPLRDYLHTQWTQHDGVPLGRVVKV